MDRPRTLSATVSEQDNWKIPQLLVGETRLRIRGSSTSAPIPGYQIGPRRSSTALVEEHGFHSLLQHAITTLESRAEILARVYNINTVPFTCETGKRSPHRSC